MERKARSQPVPGAIPEKPSGIFRTPLRRRDVLGLAAAELGLVFLGKEANRLVTPDYKRAEQVRDTLGLQITDPDARRRLFEEGLPPEIKPSEVLARELHDPRRIPDLGEDGLGTGQRINGLFLNRRQMRPGATLNLYLPRIFNPVEGLSKYGIEQIAAIRPGEPMLALDYPAMGSSDGLTGIQKDTLENERSTREIARTVARIAQNMGAESLNIIGPSLGSLVGADVASLAPEYGMDVKNFVAISPAGVKEFTQSEMLGAFTAEGEVLDVYHSWPYDPKMRKESFLNASWTQDTGETVLWLVDILVRHGIDSGYNRSILDGQLSDTMQVAMSQNPDMKLTVMYGTADRVSPVGPNRKMVSDLQATAGSRVRQIEYKGEHHAFMDNGRRIAGAVNDVLEAA